MIELAQTFALIIPHLKPNFRESTILPKLLAIAEKNRKYSEKDRVELAQTILEAYRSFNGLMLGQEAIVKYIVPGLKTLQFEADHMEISYKNMLLQMIRDMERVVTPPPVPAEKNPQPKTVLSTVANPISGIGSGLGTGLNSIWGSLAWTLGPDIIPPTNPANPGVTINPGTVAHPTPHPVPNPDPTIRKPTN